MPSKKDLLCFGKVRYDRYLKYLSSILPLTYNYLKTLSREEIYEIIKSYKIDYTLHYTDY